MSKWKKLLAESVTSPGDLPGHLGLSTGELDEVVRTYPMRINPYFLGLIKRKGDPIYAQCIPDTREITDPSGLEDPLDEEARSPVPGLTHRYPDRVLFLVSGRCAVYCRFCNRKRKVGKPGMVSNTTIEAGLRYIRDHHEIRDVLLSGGDPLLLENNALKRILSALRAMRHVEIIRIGTRVPCTLPQRVTPALTDLLKKYHPLYVVTHFNHPREITRQSASACERLADAGIPVGSQTVLLRGINDRALTIRELMRKLLTIRVRPYYLFQADLARGTAHFWTPLDTGLRVLDQIHGHTSGLCAPHFAVDLPGGGGKVPMLPDYAEKTEKGRWILRNYQGKKTLYPPPEAECFGEGRHAKGE
ncbi:MAG: KamA family radical SAM protein [Deltaproteobacteria bacterium]|nr:KamA family radical SAM protein [Deltaproteobacteria bacterium]MBW1922806.1 KamA family radical SAM protein [Deltaproteobacteria bacterium]MBW1948197.1 KamA family radical SAM protein [Deltaproteobacteria bacterium]MBW2006543.1 KamA family radical SAM protein [Deltaproteobacteria bacterium]MBW2101319.1 KamA family radical SAM protein [Deltaproteobacteria bacterium]